MDTTEATYGLGPPALDPFGGPHFTGEDDDRVASAVAWTGDPSSVPLAAPDGEHRFDRAGDQLDESIFAALVAG